MEDRRIGESEANVAGIIISDPAVGTIRYGLTQAGRQVVASVANDFLQKLTHEHDIRPLPALRERYFGELETASNTRYDDVWAVDRKDPSSEPYGAESADAVRRRTALVIDQCERNDDERCTYVLVSHGDALQILQTAFQAKSASVHRSLPHLLPGELRELIPSTVGQRQALIVVDMSVEQVATIDYRKKALIESIRAVASNFDWRLKLDSRLWFRVANESSLATLLSDSGISFGKADSPGADLIPELKDLGLEFIEKKHYSCFVNSDLMDRLKEVKDPPISEVFIVGINTDYCVFATALDAFSRGGFDKVRVIKECVSTLSGIDGHKEGIRWTRQWFGDCSVISMADVLTI